MICILFDSIFIIAATNSNLLVEFAGIVGMELLLKVITPIQKARIIVKVTMLLMAQRNMYRPTVENIVDSNLGQGYFASFLTGPVTDAAVAALIKKAGFSSVVAFAASALLWGINELRVKPDEWWTDSLLMIIKKQISCVRLSHIRNTGTSYPAAWLILERI